MPINEKEYVIELAHQFDAAVVLVISSYLGCINHSLLSINYLLSHNYKIQGLIFNGNFDEGVLTAIKNYKDLPVLAEIPGAKHIDKNFVTEQAAKININQF